MAKDKHCPETERLAREAYRLSGCKSHPEFVALLGGSVGLRTFRGWLTGEQPATPLALFVLRQVIGGWRPSR